MDGRAAVAIWLLALAALASACASADLPPASVVSAGAGLYPGEESVILVVGLVRVPFPNHEARIEIAIDGLPLDSSLLDARREYWIRDYSLALEPGEHVLKASTDGGRTVFARTFRVTGRHWAYLWCKDGEGSGQRLAFDLADRGLVIFF